MTGSTAFPGTDDTFTVVIGDDGDPYLLLRPACESLGISVSSQLRRLHREPWATLADIDTTGADGSRRKMAALHRDAVPMWLATIRPSRVSESAREKLVAFQHQAAGAMCDHFYRGVSVAPSSTGQIDVLQGMVDALRGHGDRIDRAEILATEAAETERRNAARIAALEGDHEPGRIAALAYAVLHGLPTDVDSCRRLGVVAGKIGRNLGLAVQTVPHPVYRTQNIWPDHVWDAAVKTTAKAPALSLAAGPA